MNLTFGEELRRYLIERKGINVEYPTIVEEVFNTLINIKPQLIDSDLYLLKLDKFKLKNESFISELSIKVFFGKNANGGSSFLYNKDTVLLDDKDRLINCLFTIFVPSIDNKFDYKTFSFEFSHELHHAYTYYNILVKNNGRMLDSEHKKREMYNINLSMLSTNQDNNVIKQLKDYIHVIYYLSDVDEVQANQTMLYDYLKNNPHIDETNINEYESELPCLEQYKQIEDAWKFIEMIVNFNKEIAYQIIGGEIKGMYKSNITDNKAVLFLKQRASDAMFRYKRNYFRTISLVFKKIQEENGNMEIGFPFNKKILFESKKDKELTNFINNKFGF